MNKALAIPPVPDVLLDGPPGRFMPCPEWAAWAKNAFVMDGPLFNPDHAHLAAAEIGILLTTALNTEKGKQVLGTAQAGKPSGKPWPRAQREQQILEWFGAIPDFIIILDANFLVGATPLQTCALVDGHELYHCGQRKNPYGEPMYDDEDRPLYCINGHDIEAFAGEVRRYGAWKEDIREFQEALWHGPTMGEVWLNGICGCGAKL